MGSAVETFGQRIISRRPLSRFIQIDRLVTILTGAGTETTPAFSLPHARYSVFPTADPERAAWSFALLDQTGYGVRADWSNFPPDVVGLSVPLVQHELMPGAYRLTIEASPSCAWQVQVVLNSMMSWAAPPPAWHSPAPPEASISIRNGGSAVFRIPATGHYTVDFTVGGYGQRLCPYNLDLRAADGHLVHIADNQRGGTNPVFLGAGNWMCEMETPCEWQLTIASMVGPSGGGTRWF